MKKIILCSFIALAAAVNAQQGTGYVGINTTTPATTLQVVGTPTDTTKFDGITAPLITGDQLAAKTYTAVQKGAMIYATAPATKLTGQVVNVSKEGYYYFDGAQWVAMAADVQPIDWHITGNAGTDPNVNYIGTNDGKALVFASKTSPTASRKVWGFLKPNGDVAFGAGAGNFPITTSGRTVVIGGNAAIKLEAPSINNTIVGSQAGYNLTTAKGNALFGVNAGSSLTTETGNTVVGEMEFYNFKGNYNTILGSHAGPQTTGTFGDYNIIIGNKSGTSYSSIVTGNNNIHIAGYKIHPTADGEMNIGNIILAKNVTMESTPLNNLIAGGYDDAGIGTGITTVGIGIADPVEKLEVNGRIRVKNQFDTVTAGQPCTSLGTITFNFQNGNFYGCAGAQNSWTADPMNTSTGTWKQLNN